MNNNIKDLIHLNLKEIIKLTNTILMWIIALAGFLASCYEDVGRYDFLSMSGMLFIMIMLSFVLSIVKICYYDNSNTVYKCGPTEINICYGDLFKLNFGNRTKKVDCKMKLNM